MNPYDHDPNKSAGYPGEKGPGDPGAPLPSDKSSSQSFSTATNPAVTTPAVKTPTEIEFEAGAQLARDGKDLPGNASLTTKEGYQSVSGNSQGGDPAFYPKPPGTARATPGPTEPPTPAITPVPTVLTTHQTPIQAQTDRPEPPIGRVGHQEPANPNKDVKITIVDPGKAYSVTGIGSGTKINFADITEEALMSILIDRLEAVNASGYDVYHENAAADLRKALDWRHQRDRNRATLPSEGLSGGARIL